MFTSSIVQSNWWAWRTRHNKQTRIEQSMPPENITHILFIRITSKVHCGAVTRSIVDILFQRLSSKRKINWFAASSWSALIERDVLIRQSCGWIEYGMKSMNSEDARWIEKIPVGGISLYTVIPELHGFSYNSWNALEENWTGMESTEKDEFVVEWKAEATERQFAAWLMCSINERLPIGSFPK